MIDDKKIPEEFVSIRNVWLQNISRCCEAISNRAKPDGSINAGMHEVGDRTVYHTVTALYYSLIDYGEALVKTDCEKIKKEFVQPKMQEGMSWSSVATIYQRFFEKMIDVLNKYGMLFESTPRGYSNVEMISVQ
jgi:hypothetical protein